MTRQDDAYRHASLYEQLVTRAQHEGALSADPTDAEVLAVFDSLRADGKLEGTVHKLIGDDLIAADLDALWTVFAGPDGPDHTNPTPGWWADKPHQIAYRLVLRLTRAEDALKAALLREGLRDPEKRRELSDALRDEAEHRRLVAFKGRLPGEPD